MKKEKRILAAMSGGVDSSLSAALLKAKGFDVIGATMKFWPKEDCGDDENRKACCSLRGIEDARHVADRLGIPHYIFDFNKEFKEEVIDYFCREYAKGFTPNPCIVCNQRIKFALLLKKADSLGCEHIATGHYAKTGYGSIRHRYFIKEGADKAKDQSYFLSFLSQAAIARSFFPLENMTKIEARRLAKYLKLGVHDKRSSQEVCFIRGHYTDYVKNWSGEDFKEGDVVNNKGEKLGRHKGIHFYTIGQRRGLGIAFKEPLYVIKIDIRNNLIIAGTKDEVSKKAFIAEDPNWGMIRGISKPIRAFCKIRYAHKKAHATIEKLSENKLKVVFDEPQIAPTPGQAAVFYKGDKVLGGAWIKSVVG